MIVFTAIDLSQPRKFMKKLVNGDLEINREKFKSIVKVTATTVMITITSTEFAFANPIADRVASALNPLIEAMMALGTPICTVAIISGAIVLMFNKRAGMKIIKTAGIGYLVLQFTPGIIGILGDVGKALKGW